VTTKAPVVVEDEAVEDDTFTDPVVAVIFNQSATPPSVIENVDVPVMLFKDHVFESTVSTI
jgi:hypothetical protein